MLLLVGLGNPGAEHAGQRHNVGFMAVDRIVHRHGFAPWRKRFQSLVAEGTIGGAKTLVLKPQTYMNRSGSAVAAALGYYRRALSDLVVVHDELDLAPFKVRVKTGGGAGGHNGIRDIDAHLGPDYRRVRIGIGHPGQKELVHGYVLHDFAKAELPMLNTLLDAVAEHVPLLVAGDDGAFMSKVALAVNPPRPKQEKPGGAGAKPDAPSKTAETKDPHGI